ncbi:thermonuclease family protein [Parasphingopyxis sp. CP4]|nr:thermonuclease family protein [Parasphingopyxis sp. CP4]
MGGLFLAVFSSVFLLVFVGLGWWDDRTVDTAPQSFLTPAPNAVTPPSAANADSAAAERISFSICGIGQRINCVVDGDTIWMRGEKIRLLGIDTPELSPSRCAEEERLGQAAKRRLHGLLNSGVVTLERDGRDQDRYGRLLRRVYVDGNPVGPTLIREGLARPYGNGRRSWC